MRRWMVREFGVAVEKSARGFGKGKWQQTAAEKLSGHRL